MSDWVQDNFQRSGPDLEQFIMELRAQALADALKAWPVTSKDASRLDKSSQGTSCRKCCRKHPC